MASNKLFKEGVEVDNGRFVLKVTNDRLRAFLETTAPEVTEEPDLFLLKDELAEHGLLPEPQPIKDKEGTFDVATGMPAENGKDAVIKHHITISSKATAPKRKNSGSREEIDHRELHHLINVRQGQLLAEKLPHTPGKPGKDVFGAVISAKDGKDIPLNCGQGVDLSDDGSRLIAKTDGEYRLTNGKSEVFDKYLVRGNVDMSVGNIAFGGLLLTIKGNVLPGFKVKCRGDINIGGEVNNAMVTAGGELTVKRGIVGRHARIKSRYNISAAIIEEGPMVQSKAGSLTVTDHIIQSRIYVAGDIVVTLGKGYVRGGQYMAGGSFYAMELGSEGEVNTEVTVGIGPELQQKKLTLEQENPIWQDRMTKVNRYIDGFKRLKKRRGKLEPEQNGILEQLQKVATIIARQLAGLKELQNQIHQKLDRHYTEGVYISSRLFPGVTSRIGNATRIFTEPVKGVVIYQDLTTRQIFSRPITQEDKPPAEGGGKQLS